MKYGPEVKAAVLADLLSGLSVRKTAKKHGVSFGTVQSWKAQERGVLDTASTVKKDELGELVIELVLANLRGLRAIALLPLEDGEWLKKQSAHDLAIYAGTQTDKIIGVLNALRVREQRERIDAPVP